MTPALSIQDDVPCASCGYNLRGLSPGGKCPECGDSIRAALRFRWMQRPENRRRQRQGLAMQITAIALAGLGSLPLIWACTTVLRADVSIHFYYVAIELAALLITAAIFSGTRPVEGVRPSRVRWPLRLGACLATLIVSFLNYQLLAPRTISWTLGFDPWHALVMVSLAVLLLWTVEVLPVVETLEASSRHPAKGWGYTTVSLLGLFLTVGLIVGLEQAGCLSVILAFLVTSAATVFYWSVGRELCS
jgi:hypothetical protein